MQEFKALSDSEREEWDRKVFESGINFVEEMKKYKLAGATTGKNLKDGASPRSKHHGIECCLLSLSIFAF